MRWQPLPIDSQVVAAIEDRKEKFIEAFNNADKGADEQWIFNHVCVVLEHTKKIFELSEQELCDLNFVDKLKDENND